jgi:nitrite reductase/ring-hydroxylating ferredoxin subunit/thioredoxin reductase
MSNDNVKPEGPDFGAGVDLREISDGSMLTGHVDGEAVLLVRHGETLFAIGATCTHYGGPLARGLVVGETIRCPWHHASFDLSTGEPLRAPALDPLPRWRVDVNDGVAFVREKLGREPSAPQPDSSPPRSIMIIGGGPAGNAAAETLRREGFAGPITMLSADSALPCDRPNLSKDYLAGKAPEEWTVLRSADFYQCNTIEVQLNTRVTRIDTDLREVRLADGTVQTYGKLLLATGAEPVRLNIPGADRAHVHYLRTLDDSRTLVEKAKAARSAVVIGASFIGLEVASSLRARDIEVHVVGLEAVPMAHILGEELGSFIRSVHEKHGVTFHLGRAPAAIDKEDVTLSDGTRIEADLVVIGIGVWPATSLAERAGLATTSFSKPARQTCLQPEILRAGRTPAAASTFGSSTSSWPSGRGRRRLGTCLGSESRSMPCPSSGPNSMTSESPTSAMQRTGMRSGSTVRSKSATVPSLTSATGESSR